MKKDDTYRSQFRLPYDLYESLKSSAEENHRSLNAEIVDRLSKSVDAEKGFSELGSREMTSHDLEGIRETLMEALDRLSLDIKARAHKNKGK